MSNYPEQIVELINWIDEQVQPLSIQEEAFKRVSQNNDLYALTDFLSPEQIGAMVALQRIRAKILQIYSK